VDRLLIALAIAVAATAVALLLRRRRPDAPTGRHGLVPDQLDRADFVDAQRPWLVAVFTSSTCSTCADVEAKAAVLASDDVAVEVIEYTAQRELHRRYHIEAVPLVAIADKAGVVRRHFLGPVSATDLWAAVADVRAT
jgi:hypothetical protein